MFRPACSVCLCSLLSAGHGLWLDREQQLCLILWKKLDAWAQTVYEWARGAGMEDSVMTVDELSSSDETRGTGHYLSRSLTMVPAAPGASVCCTIHSTAANTCL